MSGSCNEMSAKTEVTTEDTYMSDEDRCQVHAN